MLPTRPWVGDLIYVRTWEGRSYFAFLIDVFTRMFVGRQLATHMRTDLVLTRCGWRWHPIPRR